MKHGDDNTLPGTSGCPTQQYIDESIRQLADMTSNDNKAFQEYLSQCDELLRIYIENIQDTEDNFDHRFGVRRDIELDKFFFGNSQIDFNDPDMRIKGIRYKGTPRLYELLFKKNPLGFNKKDQEEYMGIMKEQMLLILDLIQSYHYFVASKILKRNITELFYRPWLEVDRFRHLLYKQGVIWKRTYYFNGN